MKGSNQLVGLFLEFPHDQVDYINKRLEELGYDRDPGGMKQFIMDSLDADRGDPGRGEGSVAEQVRDFITENPELIEGYFARGRGLVDSIVGAIKKGRG